MAIGKTREGLMAVKLLWSEDNDIKMQVQDIASGAQKGRIDQTSEPEGDS